MAKTLLEARDLVTNFYTYEGVVKALDKVSLTINHGETFGLVGESGCGKSVTVRSMMRIIQSPGKIENGEVWFFEDPESGKGEELLSKSEEWMQSLRGDSISMIFQEPNAALNPVMTVGEQVAESFMFHRMRSMCTRVLAELDSGGGAQYGKLAGLFKFAYRAGAKDPKAPILSLLDRLPLLKLWRRAIHKEALRRSAEIIGKLGISNPEELCSRHPHNMSGGMKQRIVIAIALACNPTLLIADEATSNLDVTIQAQILELLNELKEEVISSVLLITHDLGVVAETCDRVGVMYAGTLVELADVKTVFNSPMHPYTRALLNSVPRFTVEGELATIEGAVPNLVTPPDGCRFHPRCPHADELCKRQKPDLTDLGNGHFAACHHIDAVKAEG